MKNLDSLFASMLSSLEPKWKAESLSNTLTDGSLVNSGKMITSSTLVPVVTTLAIREEAPPTTSPSPSNSSTHSDHEPLHWKKRPIGETPDAREALAVLVGSAHAIQNNYNVPAEYVALRIVVFQKELSGFVYEVTDAAFKTHMRQSPNVPTVHDILQILKPPPPVFEAPMVILIQKKLRDNGFITEQDRAYRRNYEQQELNKNAELIEWQKRQKPSDRSPTTVIDHAPITDIEPMED